MCLQRFDSTRSFLILPRGIVRTSKSILTFHSDAETGRGGDPGLRLSKTGPEGIAKEHGATKLLTHHFYRNGLKVIVMYVFFLHRLLQEYDGFKATDRVIK